MMKKGLERIYKGQDFTVFHQNIPKKHLKSHQHQEAHLFIPLEGQVELQVDGSVYKVNPGKMIFISGNVNHSFLTNSESGERLILQFSESRLRKLKSLKSSVCLLPTHPLLKDLSLSLFPYSDSQFVQPMENLILEILSENLLLQKVTSENKLFLTQQKVLHSLDPVFRKAAELMENELELSVEELAEKTGVSKRTFTRLIQAEMDMSPKELYTYYRIQRACELIFQGQIGLTAIAYECGYSSLSQFIENFKRWTGMKPSEFIPSH